MFLNNRTELWKLEGEGGAVIGRYPAAISSTASNPAIKKLLSV